jgi:N-acetylmuramoyl-L-alanine amidase
VCAALAVLAALTARTETQGTASTYTVYSTDGRRSLPFRPSGGADFVTLDQLATLFNLTTTEDSVVGGLTVRGRGQTVLLIPGQSFASIGPGRIVSLPAPVQHDRNTWSVPVDFIRLALGPALNLRVDIRRASHTILLGDVRLPHVTGRFERLQAGGRLTFQIEPPAPHQITRQGSRLVIRFDAVGVEIDPVAGLSPDLIAAVHADGSSLLVDLGSAVASYRADDPDADHLTIDVLPANAPPPAAAAARPPAEPPAIDMAPAGTLRTVVLDPGHGGDDQGTLGPGGTREKDLVLQIARRTKAAIESRIGLRVLLTRDTDEDVPLERRTALANNNKAGLFVSLHANAAMQPATRGAAVLSLRLSDYASRLPAGASQELPVPVVGGGSRAIDVVPWDLAQIPFAARSRTLASTLSRRLNEHKVPLFVRPTAELPLRALSGTNMPAVLVEMGFLTNAEDEKALTSESGAEAIVGAIVDTIADVRRGALTSAGQP